MITFTKNDFNLAKILKVSNLLGYRTKKHYHFYGLCDKDDTSHVLFTTKNRGVYEIDHNLDIEYIMAFFRKNGISTKRIFEEEYKNQEFPLDLIKIGLRRNIRNDVDLCSSIVKSIVYGIEQEIIFRKKYIYNQEIPAVQKIMAESF